MMSITKRHGTEGPKHDPYAFEERIAILNDKKIILHEGLGTWLRVDDRLVRDVCARTHHTDAGRDTFEKLIGMTIEQFDRAYDKIHGPKGKCPKCGCRNFKSCSGYPGESFEICIKCNTIVNGYFDESAVI